MHPASPAHVPIFVKRCIRRWTLFGSARRRSNASMLALRATYRARADDNAKRRVAKISTTWSRSGRNAPECNEHFNEEATKGPLPPLGTFDTKSRLIMAIQNRHFSNFGYFILASYKFYSFVTAFLEILLADCARVTCLVRRARELRPCKTRPTQTRALRCEVHKLDFRPPFPICYQTLDRSNPAIPTRTTYWTLMYAF